MTSNRKTAFDEVSIPQWRWSTFLDYTLKALSEFSPEIYSIPIEFIDREAYFGSKIKSNKVLTSTWACRTSKLRQVRASCVEAGSFASVFNLLISPFHTFELPFFGADLVRLASGYLLAVDLQPVIYGDNLHSEFILDRLKHLHGTWQSKLPSGGPIPKEAQKFFSPGFLWTRFPLGEEAEHLIDDVVHLAYKDYLALYLDLVKESKSISVERSSLLLAGQKKYMNYRATKDPARGMLSRFYGSEWTESYINNVLFDL